MTLDQLIIEADQRFGRDGGRRWEKWSEDHAVWRQEGMLAPESVLTIPLKKD